MRVFFERIHAKSIDHGQAPVLLVAFGDSVTEGSMEHGLWESKSTYHFFVQQLLEQFFPGATFSTINAGFAGDTATKSLARLDRDVIHHDPDLVYVAFGLNDSIEGILKKEEFADALHQIVQRIRQNTTADIVLLTPSWMAQAASTRIHPEHQNFTSAVIATQTEGILAEYAQVIRQIATEEKVLLADVHREWDRLNGEGFPTDQWLTNGLNHPNAAGHRLAGLVVFNRIMDAFRKYRE